MNRAVSPVIGVILMVAITVILAAVIGAFVLEIGDQQETAPNTSFESEQKTKFMVYRGDFTANATVVETTHAGGDIIDVKNFKMKVNGNESTWGTVDGYEKTWAQSRDDPTIGVSGKDGAFVCAGPQPDFRPALGSNEPLEFSSGQDLQAVVHHGFRLSFIETDGDCDHSTDGSQDFFIRGSNSDDETDLELFRYPRKGSRNDILGDADAEPAEGLENGDMVRIVWEASSGGKTQTLFKYKVQ